MIKKMRYRVIAAAMTAFAAVILLVAVLVIVVNYRDVTRRMDETISYIYDYESGNAKMPVPAGTQGPPTPGRTPGPPAGEMPPGKSAQDSGTETPPGKSMPASESGITPDNSAPAGSQGDSVEEKAADEAVADPGSDASSDGAAATSDDAPFMALPDVEENYMTRFFVVRFDADDNIMSTSLDYVASVDTEEARQLAEQVLSGGRARGYINEYRYNKENIGDTTVIIFLNAMRDLEFMSSLRSLTLAVALVSLLLVFVLVVLFSGRAIRPIANNISRQKQFITDASHELKTPLTSISTSLDVITMEHGDDEWTDNIRKQTGRMSKLVSELVQLSRLDEEIPLPNKEHFSLSTAAWEIADVFKPQAAAVEKKLDIDIKDGVSLYGDKAAIQQLISVLLDNAIRYSDPKGDIRFSVYKKRNRAVIEAFNTCGLNEPPDTDKLFDRFYRPDSSRSTETGGNGVGLAIARAVAEAHGGTISAACPSGKTMTIKVIL